MWTLWLTDEEILVIHYFLYKETSKFIFDLIYQIVFITLGLFIFVV